jgi:hypothetical protein
MGNQSDEFKAIGLPLLMILTFAGSIALNRQGFARAFQQSKYNTRHFALWLGAFVSALLSMFLYFTAAWAYGLVCTLVCYMFTLMCGTPSLMDKHSKAVAGAVAVWFATLVGVPAFLGKGAIGVVTGDCDVWFGTVSGTMCKKGWLAFAEIVVTVLVAVTFLSMMTLMGNAAEGADEGGVDHPGQYAAVGHSNAVESSNASLASRQAPQDVPYHAQ